jgi:hypothetical protein
MERDGFTKSNPVIASSDRPEVADPHWMKLYGGWTAR